MMRYGVGVLSAAVFGFAAAAAPVPADLVLIHGRIHTEDPSRSVAQAMAVRGNTIVAVGADQAVSALVGPNTRTVDLGGRVVLPGIIDAHTHPAESAQDLGKCSLDDKALTPADIESKVAACLKARPGDRSRWFEVVMVNPSGLTLALADLDAMLPDRPLLLSGSDGHTVWANSAVLKLAHITAQTKDPAGGHIERNAAGQPTGTLRDNAAEIPFAAKPAASLDAQASLLNQALDSMRAIGITSVQDAAVDDHIMQVYKYLYDGHRLNMRVRGSFHLKNLHEPAAVLIGKATAFRAKWAIDPDFLRADAVKIFADGVIEYPSQTASLLKPYLDAHGRPTKNRGPSYFTRENLNQIVTAADAAGLTVGVSSFDAFAAMEHAITRAEHRGSPPLLPEQSLRLQDMVDAYTINAAYALKQEITTGSIEVGKRGDFIVLDRDIFSIDPYELHDTQVRSTYLDGREVYSAKPE